MVLHLELADLDQFETYVVDSAGSLATAVGCEDIGVADSAIVQVKQDVANQIRDIADIKFFVGQSVEINGTGLAQAIQTKIVDIELVFVPDNVEGATNITYSMTFEDVVPAGTTNVLVSRAAATNPNPNINFEVLTMELALTYVNVEPKPMSMLEYPTFKTELISVNAPYYEKILDIEPECVNVFIMFKTFSQLPSNLRSLQFFRLRVDGVDVINRDIRTNFGDNTNGGGVFKIRDGLYYDLLNDAFANGGLKLKNVDESLQPQTTDALSVSSYFRYDDKSLILCVPTFQTPTWKKLQVQLGADGNVADIDRLYVYKHCVKAVKL
jgi:hypothetical protein